MRITRIRAADFRNVPFADVDTDAPRVFLLGENGQGKTNLLEAAGLVSAFRSFRTTEIAPLVRNGCKEARVRIDVRDRQDACSAVEVRLAKGSRTGQVDGTPVTSVAAHLGRFPTVAFCSDDLRLVRGSPSNRRRWLDAALGGTDPAYLEAVRSYQKGLEGRNALLKTSAPSDDELRAFESAMLPAARLIIESRARQLPEICETLRQVAARAGFSPAATVRHRPDTPADELEGCWRRLRAAELAAGSTLKGPHRDDFDVLFDGQDASDYASEGQQRLIVLGLTLARVRRDSERAPTPPVILADDVLGELDEVRRSAFWKEIGEGHQVIATGTRPPPGDGWLTYEVSTGTYRKA
ncbi:MAG: DNA replication/repair protein RecF [Opitutales bacterium]|jgi:DNA replication and repair protein RecF